MVTGSHLRLGAEPTAAFLTDSPVLPGERHVLGGSWADETLAIAGSAKRGDLVVLIARAAYHRDSRPLIGLLAVVDHVALEKGRAIRVEVAGLSRVEVVGEERSGDPWLVQTLAIEPVVDSTAGDLERLHRLASRVQRRSDSRLPPDLLPSLAPVGPDALADWIACQLRAADETRLALLGTPDWTKRLPILEGLGKAQVRDRGTPLFQRPKKGSLNTRLKRAAVPANVKAVIKDYLDEPRTMHGSPGREAAKIALDLVWTPSPPPAVELREVRRMLDASHFGMDSAKAALLDVAVTVEWQRRMGKAAGSGRTLCLVGPPGTGKTSLAKAAAMALGRHLEVVPLGGVDDLALAGADRAYTRARPGLVVRRLQAARAHPSRVLFLLDEIDKIMHQSDRAPTAVLLALLDPSQNARFQDRFLDELPIDLTGTLFVATANEEAAIPSPLRDRLECVEVPGYTRDQLLEITRAWLLPRLFADLGITEEVKVAEAALCHVVFEQFAGQGCRELERRLQRLVSRGLAMHMDSGKPVTIDVDMAREWVPPGRESGIGFRANGPAWNALEAVR